MCDREVAMDRSRDAAPVKEKDDQAASNLLECVNDCTATSNAQKTGKVTGIGGVFLKSQDPKALGDWYENNLGIKLEKFGVAIFKWPNDKAEDGGATAWGTFDNNSSKFSRTNSDSIINYRVENLDGIYNKLKSNNAVILPPSETSGSDPIKGPTCYENGKFLWVKDPDGREIELWEPRLWDEKNLKNCD